MAKKLKIDSLSSPKFKSFCKGKDLDQILNHYGKSSSFSKKSDIEDVIADLIGLRALNELTKQEMIAIDNIVNDLTISLKDTVTNKKIETVGISTSEIKKLSAVAEKANKSTNTSAPKSKVTAKPQSVSTSTQAPKQKVVNKPASQAPVVVEKPKAEKSSDFKESPEFVKVKETVKRIPKNQITNNHHGYSHGRRSADQIHEEKMAKVAIDRVKVDNQTQKLILQKESLLLRDKELVLHEKRLLEDIRHRQESELAETSRVTARMLEASNKTLEETEKSIRTNIIEKNKSKRISLEKYKAKSMYDYSMSDVGQANMKDKNKTTRSVARSKLKISENNRLKAEIAMNMSAARNAVKLKDIEYKYTRDKIRELNRKKRESQAKKDRFHQGVANVLHESSPLLGYSYQFANHMFNKTRTSKDTKPEGEGDDSDWVSMGIGGLAALGGGSILGKVSKVAKATKGRIGAIRDYVNKRNPAYYKGPNAKPDSFASRAASVVGKNIGSQFLKSTPILSGVASGVMEYNQSGSATKGAAVGAGALAGAAMGAAFGAMIPVPGGMLIGSIVGGVLGEQGMKTFADKFLGKSGDMFTVKPAPQSLKLFNSNQSSVWVPQSSGGASKNSSNKQQMAMDYFQSQGYTKEQSAGIVGNLMAESNLNEKAKFENNIESSYGIAQWNSKGSPERLQAFQSRYGKHVKDASFEEQLEFIAYELKNNEKSAGNKLSKTTSASEAASIFDQFYERSSGEHRQKRISFAEQLMMSDSRLSSTQSMVDKQEKANKSTPAPVNVVNSQGGATVNNVNNTTVWNAPETDPVIRSQAFVNYAFGRVL